MNLQKNELRGLGLEHLMTFDAHRFVDEDAEAFGEAVVALLGQELQDVVQEFRIGVVGHVVWWCLSTPQQETNVARPRPVFHARSVFTPPGFGCARLATLAFAPPHPGGVKTEGRKTNYRQQNAPA